MSWCRPYETRSDSRLTPDLPNLCENASYAPLGAESFPTCTQGFRPGLYSGAASRLGITTRLPLVVSECEFSHRFFRPWLTFSAPAGLVFASFHSTSSTPVE